MKYSNFLFPGGFFHYFLNEGINVYNQLLAVLISYSSMDTHGLRQPVTPRF